MIYTNIPYAPVNTDKNLGAAYNSFMNLLGDDDWACFVDHDASFTTPDWYHQLEEIISLPNSDTFGMLTAVTNRIGNVEQIVFRKDSVEAYNHDMLFHRKIGRKLQQENRLRLIDVVDPISGVIVLISKKVWKQTKGFMNGFLSVDNEMDYQLRRLGYKNYIMAGVYCYHLYRANYLIEGGLVPTGYN